MQSAPWALTASTLDDLPLFTSKNGHQQPSAIQRHWLTRPGSLTAALSSLGEFSLQRLQEGRCRATSDDIIRLGLATSCSLWRRDVVLYVDQQPCIFASSVAVLGDTMPDKPWHPLRHQGSAPLATLLYQDDTFERSPFCWYQITLTAALTAAYDLPSAPLWARHSRFTRLNCPMVVTEVFLADFWPRFMPQ